MSIQQQNVLSWALGTISAATDALAIQCKLYSIFHAVSTSYGNDADIQLTHVFNFDLIRI